MIINLHKQIQDTWGYEVSYSFRLEGGEEIASAFNDNKQPISFWLGKELYAFPTGLHSMKMVPRMFSGFPYPDYGRWKRLPGFVVIDSAGEQVAYYYGNAITVGRVGKSCFKRNIDAPALVYQGELYYCFKVGFRGELEHYYCIYRGNELIGVIKRHALTKKNKDCIATLYIDKKENLKVNLFVAVTQLVYVETWEGGHDISACGYISRYEEEKKLLDRGYIEWVKQQDTKGTI